MMKKIIISCGIAAIMAGVSAPASAVEAPSWNYMTLEWVASGDAEWGTSVDLRGYRLEAAKGLGEHLFVRAAANNYYAEESGIRIDIGANQLGVGGHYPIATGAATFDLWGEVNYQQVAIEGLVATGPGVDIGVRAKFSDAFEVGVAGKVYGDMDLGDIDVTADYTGYTVTAAFAVAPDFAIQGSYSNYELDFDETGIDVLEYKNVFALGARFTY